MNSIFNKKIDKILMNKDGMGAKRSRMRFFKLMCFVFCGFVLLGIGVPLAILNPFEQPLQEQPEEELGVQKTFTVGRVGSNSYQSVTIWIWNCTTGSKISITGNHAFSFSNTDLICIYVNTGGTNYNLKVYGIDTNGDGVDNPMEDVVDQIFFLGSAIVGYSNQNIVGVAVNSVYSDVIVTYNANGGSFNQNSSSGRNYSAGTRLFTFGGRDYYKKYSSYAYIGWTLRQANWAWPIIVGTTANSVAYYTSANTSLTHTYKGTFTYNNKTYYYSSMEYHMQHQFDTAYYAPYINTWRYLSSSSKYTEAQFLQWIASRTVSESSTLYENWTSGGTLNLPGYNPTRTGYSFKGWYTASSGGSKVSTSTTAPSANNTVYYAQWTAISYTIKYHATTGTTYSATPYYITSTVTLRSSAACNEGYRLLGWEYGSTYASPGASIAFSTLYNAEGVDSSNILHLYARETVNYYYVYFLDYDESTIDCYEVAYSDSVDPPNESSHGLTREGYTLDGWEERNLMTTYGTSNVSIAPIVNSLGLGSTNYGEIYLYALWDINTYKLRITHSSYYDECVHSTDLISPSHWNTNFVRGEVIWINRTYSTTPLSITVKTTNSNYQYYMEWYVDGSYGGWSNSGVVTFTWTPTDNVDISIYVLERFSYKAEASEGISSAQAKSLWSASNSWTSGSTEVQGAGMSFKAGLKDGYVFDGWYKGSTKVSGNMEFTYLTNANPGGGGLRENLTLTAKAKKIYDLIQYDSADQYFYFEDGYFPQTYVGDSLNSTLNGWYSGKTISRTFYINNTLTNCYLYNGTEYARVKCPTTYTVKLKSGTSKTFSANSYYWFKLEPIRWRVSEYGVTLDYYSVTLYDKFVSSGAVNGVSHYVLDYAPIVASLTQITAGWKYTNSLLHNNISYNDDNFYTLTYTEKSIQFDRLDNNTATNTKISKESVTLSKAHQASLDDIEKAGITNLKAPVTDLVAMLAGVDSGKNLKYSTRDLFDNQNSRCVTEFGIVKNRWLDGLCGVRYAFSSTGKKSV